MIFVERELFLFSQNGEKFLFLYFGYLNKNKIISVAKKVVDIQTCCEL